MPCDLITTCGEEPSSWITEAKLASAVATPAAQARVRLVRRVEPGHPHLQGARIDKDNIIALQRCSCVGDDAGRREREPVVSAASVELARQQFTDPLATRRGWVIASHRCRQRIKAAADIGVQPDCDVVVGIHFGGKAVDMDDPRVAARIDTDGVELL